MRTIAIICISCILKPVFWKTDCTSQSKNVQRDSTKQSIDSRIVEPEIIYKPEIRYREGDFKHGRQATVWVVVSIDTSGTILDTKIWKSSDAFYNELAMQTARKYRFTPAKYFGKTRFEKVFIKLQFDPKAKQTDTH